MKSLFDSHWNTLKKVQHSEELYGASSYERRQLIFPKGLEDVLFTQNPYNDNPHYTFLHVGYEGLKPITDIEVIQKRQQVIQAFANTITKTCLSNVRPIPGLKSGVLRTHHRGKFLELKISH